MLCYCHLRVLCDWICLCQNLRCFFRKLLPRPSILVCLHQAGQKGRNRLFEFDIEWTIWQLAGPCNLNIFGLGRRNVTRFFARCDFEQSFGIFAAFYWLNGNLPLAIWNKVTPSDHSSWVSVNARVGNIISSSFSWNLPNMSGCTYSSVPWSEL